MLLPLQSALAAAPAAHAQQLTGDERMLHALNRLTFGPRPGDLTEVRRIGLDRWFEQQLHPATIDDSAFEQNLMQFPAMKLSQIELLRRFPDPQMFRMMSRNNTPLPSDPVERAIYRNGIYAERMREQKKAEKTADATGANEKAPAAATGSQDATRNARANAFGLETGYSLPSPKAANKQAMAAAPMTEATGTMVGTADVSAARTSRPANGPAIHREGLYPESDTVALLALAPAERMNRVLNMEPATLVRLRDSLSADELKRLTDGLAPEQKETLAALGGPSRVVGAETLESRLLRDVNSNRQLEAVMTDFWLNHFNVYLRKNEIEPYLLPEFERTVRAHALGRFENLLVATASSPAMLVYLDNAESIGPHSEAALGPRRAQQAVNAKGKAAARGLNENYARELMELHTVGVRCEASKDHTPTDPSCGRGYSQADVTEVARVLTGWTVTRREEGSTATYIERRHEPGDKRVLGHTIRQNGEREGLELLHLLATSPATAQFVCTKLAVRFVSDAPPPSLVAQMTDAWRKSNGDISAVLRAMFHAPEFWAPAVEHVKIKTPLEFVASAYRAAGAQTTNGVPLVQSLDRLGMPLYGMPTPNGYAWDAEPWVSTGALVARMNFALTFADNRLNGTTIDWTHTAAGSPANSEDGSSSAVEATRLELALLGRPASPRVHQTLLTQSAEVDLPRRAEQDFLGGQAQLAARNAAPTADADKRVATMAGLLLGSPDFQRR